MKTRPLLISFALGLGLMLALLWLLVLSGAEGLGGVARADATPIHYVAPTGDDTGDCTDPANPCCTVQYAVDQAGDGDIVKVAAGTYTGVQVREGFTQVVHITRSLTIQGGYTTADWDNTDPDANPTTLDAEGQGRVIYISAKLTVTLDGLQIVNGWVKPESIDLPGGAGVSVERNYYSATLTIRNCDIFSNTASNFSYGGSRRGEGGGLYLWGGALLLENSRVVSNTAGDGGGVFARDVAVTMTHDLFQRNTCDWMGGGAFLGECSAYVAHTTFEDNRGFDGGGLSVIGEGDLTLTESVFRDNVPGPPAEGYSGSGSGGGLYVNTVNSSHATITHNLFQGNVASPEGQGSGGGALLSAGYAGWLVFSHNRVLDNVASGGELAGGGLGGGLYVHGPALLFDNLIQGNWAASGDQTSARGGGVFLKGPGLQLEGNRVLNNHAARYAGYSPFAAAYGGGVYVDNQSEVTMTNNIIAGNQYCEDCYSWRTYDDSGGGGIKVGGQTSPGETRLRLYHNTIADNESPAIENESSALSMAHSILSGHTADLRIMEYRGGGYPPPTTAVDYTLWYPSMDIDHQAGTLVITHDFTGTPDFVSTSLDNYHLGPSSEAINKDTGAGAGVTTDIDGNPRPIGAGYDLGADEYTGVDLSPSRKSASPTEAGAGDMVTFTIVLLNSGVTSTGSTVLFDAIPTATTYVSDSVQATSGVVTDTGGIGWTGTIAPGQVVTVTFRVIVNEEVWIKNTAIITDGYGTVLNRSAWVNNPEGIYLPLVMKNFS